MGDKLTICAECRWYVEACSIPKFGYFGDALCTSDTHTSTDLVTGAAICAVCKDANDGACIGYEVAPPKPEPEPERPPSWWARLWGGRR